MALPDQGLKLGIQGQRWRNAEAMAKEGGCEIPGCQPPSLLVSVSTYPLLYISLVCVIVDILPVYGS